MRSVFVHLWGTSENEVAASLDGLFPTLGRPWLLQRDGEIYLYIDFYRDGPAEDECWATRFAARGGPPAVSVMADISGRHEGWEQAQEFVTQLLEHFDGAATDDQWLRLWSRQEVQDDLRVDGRKFGCWRE